MDQNFATKSDFREYYLMTKSDLKELEQMTKNDLKDFEQSMKIDMKDLEHRLTVRLGIMLASSIGLISALITFKN